MGQFVVHKEAGTLLADIFHEIGAVSPVAKAGAAGSVHQIALAAAQDKGRKKDRLAFEPLPHYMSGFDSCPQTGEQDHSHFQAAPQGRALGIGALCRGMAVEAHGGQELIARRRGHQILPCCGSRSAGPEQTKAPPHGRAGSGRKGPAAGQAGATGRSPQAGAGRNPCGHRA